MFLQMFFIGLWNNIINLLAEFNKEQKQDDFIPDQYGENNKLTPWQFKCKGARVPMFTIYYHTWQIYALPNSIFKKILQIITWASVYRYNWVLKMLLGYWKKPKEKDINEYKPMTSNRWSTILNETNTWDCHIIDEKRYSKEEIEKLLYCNILDKDLLLKLYEEKYKK
jgi:hypothetical protein